MTGIGTTDKVIGMRLGTQGRPSELKDNTPSTLSHDAVAVAVAQLENELTMLEKYLEPILMPPGPGGECQEPPQSSLSILAARNLESAKRVQFCRARIQDLRERISL